MTKFASDEGQGEMDERRQLGADVFHARKHEVRVALSCDEAGGGLLLRLAPAVLEEVREVDAGVELRPPEAGAGGDENDLFGLLVGGAVEFVEVFAGNEQASAVAELQDEAVETGLGTEGGFDEEWLIIEELGTFKGCVDLFVGSQIVRMPFHAYSPKVHIVLHNELLPWQEYAEHRYVFHWMA